LNPVEDAYAFYSLLLSIGEKPLNFSGEYTMEASKKQGFL